MLDGAASPLGESLSASAVSWGRVALFWGVDCPKWFLALSLFTCDGFVGDVFGDEAEGSGRLAIAS